jgi:ATP-dependent DNA helicase PIF1
MAVEPGTMHPSSLGDGAFHQALLSLRPGGLAMKGTWPGYEAMAAAAVAPEDRFRAAARGGRNCFLTGMAGTGKSTLLRQFIADCSGTGGKRVDITAPTGVAALNVGGMTIHRFCGMMLGPQAGQSNEDYLDVLRKDPRRSVMNGFQRVMRCQVLVIDEISMLPGRQFDFIEFLFRRLRGRDEPFGGCQVIVTGDFLQLPPVRMNEGEPYDWAFLTPAWERAEFRTVVLDTVRRQDEPQFVRALGNFRCGRVWGEDARLLQGRIKNFPPASLTRLFTHNVQVDRWNHFQLGELPGAETVFGAWQTGPEAQREFLARNLLTPATLQLKPGAVVMFTVNRTLPGSARPLFVNGQVGTVVECGVPNGECGMMRVRVKTGEVIEVERFKWSFSAQDPEAATFSQFPLRLAYAMTIHKSQGLTLDAAYLDIRAAREPGQAYVAVSRVRTLAGLHFKEWFKGLHVSPEAIAFYRAEARVEVRPPNLFNHE